MVVKDFLMHPMVTIHKKSPYTNPNMYKYVFSCSSPHIFPIKQKARETGMTPKVDLLFFSFQISPLQLANLFV